MSLVRLRSDSIRANALDRDAATTSRDFATGSGPTYSRSFAQRFSHALASDKTMFIDPASRHP